MTRPIPPSRARRARMRRPASSRGRGRMRSGSGHYADARAARRRGLRDRPPPGWQWWQERGAQRHAQRDREHAAHSPPGAATSDTSGSGAATDTSSPAPAPAPAREDREIESWLGELRGTGAGAPPVPPPHSQPSTDATRAIPVQRPGPPGPQPAAGHDYGDSGAAATGSRGDGKAGRQHPGGRRGAAAARRRRQRPGPVVREGRL